MAIEGSKPEGLFHKKNDTIRIDSLDAPDDKNRVPLMSFFRRIGAPHLYWERILPTLEQEDSLAFAAVRDRPWPPWGLGAQKIHALCLTHPIGADSVGVSPVFVHDEDLTNVGLIAAVYKDTLEGVARRKQSVAVSYLLIDGSILADRVFRANGFRKTDDIFLTEEGRYNFYRADAHKLLDHLGLAKVSTLDLLGHDIKDDVLTKNALFHAIIHHGSRGGLIERVLRPEIIAIDGGIFDAALPGGVGS